MAGTEADSIRVMVVGLGAIGASCARAVQCEPSMELVALVDADPAKVGKTTAELGEYPPGSGKRPVDEPRAVAAVKQAMEFRPQVAVLCTSSRFDQQAPMIEDLVTRGVAVVSSCEQMLWPWYRHGAVAEGVAQAAKRGGRAALGTGVNPGFVMDFLPVVLSSVVRRVTAVRCVRRVDAALRRSALQAKVGATLSVQAFEQLADRGEIGHAGLAESAAMVAAGLSRQVEPGSVHETLEPVVAEQPTSSSLGLIDPGKVSGVHHVATWKGQGLSVTLDLTMAVGLDEPQDLVHLDGPVPLQLKIPGSVPGDSATVATLLNHIPVVHASAGGLWTMLDLPPGRCVYSGC